jgi:hypothetical protein
MTPKEKAQELWWKFFHAQATEENGNLDGEIAYQCALIAVDEILSFFNNKAFVLTYQEITKYEIPYWQEVKKEIESL